MDAASVEESLAAVREQVRSLASKKQPRGVSPRVEMRWTREPTPCWRITAHFKPLRQHVPSLLFTHAWLEIDDDRILLPETNLLEIVAAGWKANTLTLCVARAEQVLASAERELEKTSELLRLAEQALERFVDPARMIAATRAIRAVSKAIEKAPVEAIAQAATAASDIEVVVRALQQPDAIETLKTDDPLGPARLRGLNERARLLKAEGGTLTVDDVAEHLGITRQAVNKRRQQGTLIGLDAGRHGYLYPAWQFVREGTLSGLEQVLEALEQHDAWMQHAFMLGRNARLGDITPLDALRNRRMEDVLKAARAFGEHGAA